MNALLDARMKNLGALVPSCEPGLIPHFPPAWAEVFGEDDCGIFAECLVQEVRFWRTELEQPTRRHKDTKI